METTKESVMKKGKRPKSPTRYPKRMPTYVVAFAVHESHDDPTINQQNSNKRNENNAAKSISSTESNNSAKTFTITPTEKLSHTLDQPTISEVKIDIIDENQCGDIDKKSPQISNYIVVDNKTADEQPEIIFNATKHIKRCKDNNKFPRKKPRKNKRVIKFKNVHFKYKNPKNSITRRLEKYYEKAKMNSPNPEQIPKQIYCNILSKVVSRSRVLKKVLAKENLLDETDRNSMDDGISLNEYDDGSLTSSPSTTKKTFISYTSQNTLVHKSSSSSRNEDFYSIKTVNSVIQVSSGVTPFKTDVLNVAVAVAFNSSKPCSNKDTTNSNENLTTKEDLTSDEIFLLPNAELTSGTPSNDDSKDVKTNYNQIQSITLNEKDLSSDTLTGYEKKSMAGIPSDDDTFVIARTSSDFNKSSFDSEFTLTSNSETLVHAESLRCNVLSKDNIGHNNLSEKANLLDSVINGFYPEMSPSTSSGGNFDSDKNNVIITEDLIKNFIVNPKNKGDQPLSAKNDLPKNVLMKSFDVEKLAFPQKNFNLPNDVAIKAKLKLAEKGQRKSCSEEVRNPTNLSEVCDRLSVVLDLAVKRLEDTLAEKILRELKKSLATFYQQEQRLPQFEIHPAETIPPQIIYEKPIPKMLHKEVFVLEEHHKEFVEDFDECIQCDLVQNQVIDQLMLKLSVEGPKPMPTSTVSLKKLKRPQIVKDYFEILKPPAVESALIEVGRGDTVTVSTATAEFRSEEYHGFQRLKLLFSGPISFIRENMFVLTSVPTFFIVLLCLYGIIVFIMKPW